MNRHQATANHVSERMSPLFGFPINRHISWEIGSPPSGSRSSCIPMSSRWLSPSFRSSPVHGWSSQYQSSSGSISSSRSGSGRGVGERPNINSSPHLFYNGVPLPSSGDKQVDEFLANIIGLALTGETSGQDSEDDQVLEIPEEDIWIPKPGPRTVPDAELEKLSRLQLNGIFNQLEELETERRSYEAIMKFPAPAYQPTPRSSLTMEGLREMLKQVSRHFELFKSYVSFGLQQRELAMKSRQTLTCAEFMANAGEVIGDEDVVYNARHGFRLVLDEFYEEWERRMDAVRDILAPGALSISCSAYFHQQLLQIIRETRTPAFMVYILYQEATGGSFYEHSK